MFFQIVYKSLKAKFCFLFEQIVKIKKISKQSRGIQNCKKINQNTNYDTRKLSQKFDDRTIRRMRVTFRKNIFCFIFWNFDQFNFGKHFLKFTEHVSLWNKIGFWWYDSQYNSQHFFKIWLRRSNFTTRISKTKHQQIHLLIFRNVSVEIEMNLTCHFNLKISKTSS